MYKEEMDTSNLSIQICKTFKGRGQYKALALVNELNLRLANIQFLQQSSKQLLNLILQNTSLLYSLQECIINLRVKFSVFSCYILEFKDLLIRHNLKYILDEESSSIYDDSCLKNTMKCEIITDILYDVSIKRNMLSIEGNIKEQIKVFKLVLSDINIFQQLLQRLLQHLKHNPVSLHKIISMNKRINIGDSSRIFNLSDQTRLSYMVQLFVKHAKSFRKFLYNNVPQIQNKERAFQHQYLNNQFNDSQKLLTVRLPNIDTKVANFTTYN